MYFDMSSATDLAKIYAIRLELQIPQASSHPFYPAYVLIGTLKISSSWRHKMTIAHWQVSSFTAPYTTAGNSALVTAPPWFYAGWLLNISFAYAPVLARGWVPPQLGEATGIGCVHFADWQACSDGRELLDPVYAQYKETIVVLQVRRPNGTLVSFCPGIWVDQDISMLRGLLQGWPKKFGSTWLTRSLPLQHPAAAFLQQGSKLGASLSCKERRLIQVTASLTGQPGEPLGFLSAPSLGLVGWPDLTKPNEPPNLQLIRPLIADKVQSQWHQATAKLSFLEHPYEELSVLGAPTVLNASAGWLGITVQGAVHVTD
jgi:hypothetical protein